MVMGAFAGTTSLISVSETQTTGLLNSGRYSATGSFKANRPLSYSAISAAQVKVFDMECSRSRVSWVSGRVPSADAAPTQLL